MLKPKILIFASYYLPGFKAGGPIHSLANLIEQFEKEYEFFVVTRDRDLGDIAPYTQVEKNAWVSVGGAKVRYLSKEACSMKVLRDLVYSVEPNVLYFNSFLNPLLTIKPLILRRLGLLPKNINVIVAPRGEFAHGALALKSFKKKLFMHAAKILGLYRKLTWQASSDFEARDIRRWFGNKINITIALNLPPKHSNEISVNERKHIGKLRIICVARVARNKNIDGAFRILEGVKGDIDFHLYGPNEDQIYWRECLHIAEKLPSNIHMTYHGQLPHEQIKSVLPSYNLFFLPTQGENFGHAILEALIAGLPVLLSDRTPWRDLAKKGVGWDLPLNDIQRFRDVIMKCVNMDDVAFREISDHARNYGLTYLTDQGTVNATRQLFNNAIQS